MIVNMCRLAKLYFICLFFPFSQFLPFINVPILSKVLPLRSKWIDSDPHSSLNSKSNYEPVFISPPLYITRIQYTHNPFYSLLLSNHFAAAYKCLVGTIRMTMIIRFSLWNDMCVQHIANTSLLISCNVNRDRERWPATRLIVKIDWWRIREPYRANLLEIIFI